MIKLGNEGKIKGSEWWNEEVKQLVTKGNKRYTTHLLNRQDKRWEEYKINCSKVKEMYWKKRGRMIRDRERENVSKLQEK